MGIRSYAQNFEDVMLWRALRGVENGFFVDIGAQHPIVHSVTKTFSERGWRGIHVEPMPEYAALLRTDRTDDDVFQVAVCGMAGTVTFYAIDDTGLSTLQPQIAEEHKKAGFRIREMNVPTMTLDTVLDSASVQDIHFLKIDVEGAEQSVIESWKTSERRPWIIVIEAHLPQGQMPSHHDWESLVVAKDYHFVYADGLNRFYVSDEHSELDDCFAVPPNVFDQYSVDWSRDCATPLQRCRENELAEVSQALVNLWERLIEAQQQLPTRLPPEADGSEQTADEPLSSSASDLVPAESPEYGFLPSLPEHAGSSTVLVGHDKLHLLAQIEALRETLDRLVSAALTREYHLRRDAIRRQQMLSGEIERQRAALIAHLKEGQDRKHDKLLEGLSDLKRQINISTAGVTNDVRGIFERQQSIKYELDSMNRVFTKNFSRHHEENGERLAQLQSKILAEILHIRNDFLRDIRSIAYYLIEGGSLFSRRRKTRARFLLAWEQRQNFNGKLPGREDTCIAHTPPAPCSNSEQKYMRDAHAISTAPVDLIEFLALPLREYFIQCYLLLLGRCPEPEAQHAAEAALRLGRGRVHMLVNIYRSPEARAYRHKVFASVSDAEAIQEMYKRYLGRPADPTGLDHFAAQLRRQNRSTVLAAFARSAEAQAAKTLWNEVELLVTQTRRDRWPWRRAAQQRRLQNLEQEIALLNARRSFQMQQDAGKPAESTSIQHSESTLPAVLLADASEAVDRPSAIMAVAEGEHGAYSARILRRMHLLSEK